MKIVFLILLAVNLLFSNTVLDKEKNLLWQDNEEAKTIKKDWKAAKEYCENLSLEGYNDWVLPSYEELLGITNKYKYKPAIKSIFENVDPNTAYWSSSSYLNSPLKAWYVDSKDGSSYAYSMKYKYNVRCVRARKSRLSNWYLGQLISALVKEELKTIKKPSELKKDEFETTAEFNKRIKQLKKKQDSAISKYKKRYTLAKEKAKKNAIKQALQMAWGKPIIKNLKYDADNGYFTANIRFEAKKYFREQVTIKVDRKNARNFKKVFDTLAVLAVFDVKAQSVSLKEIRIPYKKHNYVALFKKYDLNNTIIAIGDFD